MDRIKIKKLAPKGSEEGAHLRPVIDFLIEQGNTPNQDRFVAFQAGVSVLTFKKPINLQALKDHFKFPSTITIEEDKHFRDTVIFDKLNMLMIYQGNLPTQAGSSTS